MMIPSCRCTACGRDYCCRGGWCAATGEYEYEDYCKERVCEFHIFVLEKRRDKTASFQVFIDTAQAYPWHFWKIQKKGITSPEQIQNTMSNDCPPFLVVQAYMFSFVLAVIILQYLLIVISVSASVPLLVYVFIVAFTVIGLISAFNIYRMLFSTRAR